MPSWIELLLWAVLGFHVSVMVWLAGEGLPAAGSLPPTDAAILPEGWRWLAGCPPP